MEPARKNRLDFRDGIHNEGGCNCDRTTTRFHVVLLLLRAQIDLHPSWVWFRSAVFLHARSSVRPQVAGIVAARKWVHCARDAKLCC
jgi:hypothetical protein